MSLPSATITVLYDDDPASAADALLAILRPAVPRVAPADSVEAEEHEEDDEAA